MKKVKTILSWTHCLMRMKVEVAEAGMSVDDVLSVMRILLAGVRYAAAL